MLSKSDIRDCLHEGLSEAGFKRQGLTWKYDGKEVSWRIHLDKRPNLGDYCIEVWLRPGGHEFKSLPPMDANYAPIATWADIILPEKFNVEIMTNPSDNRVSDLERRDGLRRIGYALGNYAIKHSTTDSLLTAYSNGNFKSALILKEVRALLDKTLVDRTKE